MTDSAICAIAALDLSRIKTKLCHAASGEGWTMARADAAERSYRRFWQLALRHPGEASVPDSDTDTFWHYHILDTVQYASDCERVFGYFLHHDPHVGLDEASAPQRLAQIARTRALDAALGALPAGAGRPAYCGISTGAAYCGVTPAAGAYCGVARAPSAYCGVAA